MIKTRYVGVFIIAALVVILGFDVYLALSDSHTISHVILAHATSHPSVAFVTFVLMGHLFFPWKKAPWRRVTQWVTWAGMAGAVAYDYAAGLPGFFGASPLIPAALGLLAGWLLWPQTARSVGDMGPKTSGIGLPEAGWVSIIGGILSLLLKWAEERGERRKQEAENEITNQQTYERRRQVVRDALTRGDRRTAIGVWLGAIRVRDGEPGD